MNKLLLGVLALSTVATFAEGKYQDYHGYLDAEVKAEAKNDFDLAKKSFKNSGKPAEAKAFTSLKLGHTLYKDSQIAVFGGVKGDVYKYTPDASEALNIKDYYFGARWDAPIVDGYNVALTFANKGVVKDTKDKKVEGGYTTYKKEIDGKETGDILQALTAKSSEVVVEDQTVLKDAVSKHLEAKGKKASTDEEYENEGYKLHNAEDTTLLSAVLTGKVGGFDSHLGGIYSTRDFKDGKHTLESFVRTSGMADENVKVEGFLNHYLTSRDVDGFTTGNYAFGGRLKGGVKVTTNLNKDTILTNKAEFKLLNILSSETAAGAATKHKGEALTENELKYTGFKNFVVTTGLNYKNEFETGSVKTLKHIPEVKLGVEYANNGLTASTKNSEKAELKQTLGTTTTLEYVNLFETANKLGYMKDGFSVEGSAKYNLKTTFGTDRTHNHNLLAGLKLSYGVDNLQYEDYKVDSVLSGNYLLTATNKNFEKANGQMMHEAFVFAKNNVQLNDVFGLDLSARLNAYNYTNFNKADVTTGTYKGTGFLLTDAGLTVTKKLDKLTTSLDVNGKYGLYAKEYNKDSLQHHGSAEATIKADYLALSNVDLIGEVKGEYNYNKLGGKLYEGLASFVENNRDKDGYRTLPKYLSEKFDTKAEHDMLDQYEKLMKDEKNHELNVKPSVSAVIRLANDKLTITPKLGAEVSFSTDVKNSEKDLKPFLFKSVKGIGSLNINYAW